MEVTYAWSCLFQPNFQYAQLKPHLHYFLNEIYPQLSYPCKGIFLARSNVIFSFYLNGFEIDEEYKLMVKTLLTGLENIRLFNATTQCSLLNGLCTSLNVFTLNDDKITIPWDSIWYPISCLQVSSNV